MNFFFKLILQLFVIVCLKNKSPTMKIIQLIIKRVSDEKIKTAKQLRTPFFRSADTYHYCFTLLKKDIIKITTVKKNNSAESSILFET